VLDARGLFFSSHISRICCALVFVLILSSCDSLKSRGIAPGDLAPELPFPDLNGENFSLEKVKGKVVLINFWASWCGPCILELPNLEKLQQRLRGRDFSVIAVGIDDQKENLASFKAQYGLTFPILVDEDGASKQAYHLGGVPETLMLDKQGRVVLFIDPEDQQPTAKVNGPREWDSDSIVKQIEKLL
jgi:thiol-disulfide isomerase/thioredoxin